MDSNAHRRKYSKNVMTVRLLYYVKPKLVSKKKQLVQYSVHQRVKSLFGVIKKRLRYKYRLYYKNTNLYGVGISLLEYH